jgi:hypothetical protein
MKRCSKVSTRAAERHEYLIVGWRSVGLDARELDHLGPFLGFVKPRHCCGVDSPVAFRFDLDKG